MLPERTLLHVVDEANGGKVHVYLTLILYHGGFGNVAGLGSTFH